MKRFLCTVVLVFFVGYGFANDFDVIVYESGGETYFVAGDILDQLTQDAKDTCLEHVVAEEKKAADKAGTKYDKTIQTRFYELLLSQCRQEVSNNIGAIRENAPLFINNSLPQDPALGNLNPDYIMTFFASNQNVKLKNATIDNIVDKYKACILLRQNLQDVLSKYYSPEYKYSYNISADIDGCISEIKIIDKLPFSDESFCPIDPTISNPEDIKGLENLNSKYWDKEFRFIEKPDVKPGQIAIFNGRVMVVCDNGKPVHVVKPAFSGYVECRDAQYQSYPNVGTVPDGVYLIKHNMVEEREDTESWGGYRVPLMPAETTYTYGRANFYLHGTDDPKKRRSGGCISLGVQIEEFIESDWFKNEASDLIIVVDKYN